MANQIMDLFRANDRRLLKKILVVLGFHLVVIIAIGALEMVGINANIPNSETFVGFFMLFVGWRFFGLFEEDFGMAYADKFLAFIDHLRHTVSFLLFSSFRFLCSMELHTYSKFQHFFVKSQHSFLYFCHLTSFFWHNFLNLCIDCFENSHFLLQAGQILKRSQ